MDNKITNIKERVLQVAKYHGISYEKFSTEIGMTYASFKGQQKNTPINSNALEILLSKYPDISAYWLLTGEGEMLKTPPSETHNDKQSDDLQESLKQKDEQIEELTQRLREKELQLNSMIEIINKLSDK